MFIDKNIHFISLKPVEHWRCILVCMKNKKVREKPPMKTTGQFKKLDNTEIEMMFCSQNMGWRIPSQFKLHFLAHQMSHLAMPTKPFYYLIIYMMEFSIPYRWHLQNVTAALKVLSILKTNESSRNDYCSYFRL